VKYSVFYAHNEKGEAAGTQLNSNNGLFTLASTRLLGILMVSVNDRSPYSDSALPPRFLNQT
jgi:hypothetical protein